MLRAAWAVFGVFLFGCTPLPAELSLTGPVVGGEIISYWPLLPGGTPGYDCGPCVLWTRMPAPYSGKVITKKRDDTLLFVRAYFDVVPDKAGTREDNCFLGNWIDGRNMASTAIECGPGRDVTVDAWDYLKGYKAGPHTLDLMTGTSYGSRINWQADAASWWAMEVVVPPADAVR